MEKIVLDMSIQYTLFYGVTVILRDLLKLMWGAWVELIWGAKLNFSSRFSWKDSIVLTSNPYMTNKVPTFREKIFIGTENI